MSCSSQVEMSPLEPLGTMMATSEAITMSMRELDRLKTLQALTDRMSTWALRPGTWG